MAVRKETIDAFFKAYADRMNNALGDHPKDDVQGQSSAFADYFVESSVKGVSGGPNDDAFRAKIPEGNAYYRSLGTQSMTVQAIEMTPLDDNHVAAKVHWKSLYKKPDGSTLPLAFDVIYLLQVLNDTAKIFAYIAGDEQKMYEDNGIVPRRQMLKHVLRRPPDTEVSG